MSSPHSAAQPTSAAAASALPPAMPPATGICLVISMATGPPRAGVLGQQPGGGAGQVLGAGRHAGRAGWCGPSAGPPGAMVTSSARSTAWKTVTRSW